MTKPQKYQIEDGKIFRLRRATAEKLAEDGLLTMVEGTKLTVKYPLTPKGVAFFNFTGRRFKWVEPVETMVHISRPSDEAPKSGKKEPVTRADFFNASFDPESPYYDPRVYDD
jgi:hypothetical protein